MFLKRLITASIIAPIAIALILLLPQSWFAGGLMLMLVIGLFEWDKLTTDCDRFVVSGALAVVTLAVVGYLLASQMIANSMPWLLPILALLGSGFWILQYFTVAKGIDYKRPLKLEMTLGLVATLCAWAAMVWLRMQPPPGALLVLIAVMIVWAADTFAYLVGITIGRHKFAPSISPGKTIEGIVGGIAGALLFAGFGAYWLLNFNSAQMLVWLTAAAAAAAISVVGDLYFSRLKRQAGVKDSGKLLPGHGGMLDRIDGLIAAMPVFASVWWLLS